MKSTVRWRSLALVIPLIGLLASAAAGTAPTSATAAVTRAPFRGISNSTSSNWSGYAAHGVADSFNSVSASWIQPAGKCTHRSTYSAFWVGLDGYTSTTVEQTGSEVDCRGGSPRYYAWFEMYPASSVNFTNTVAPGDHFTSSVTATGHVFTLKITDVTRGWSHTVVRSLASAKESSAEVIAEAPCCTDTGGILPLTDFGTVPFSHSEANGSAIGKSKPTVISMSPMSQGTSTDHTSKLSDGEAFSVAWVSN
jgi:Peptidase A4 family